MLLFIECSVVKKVVVRLSGVWQMKLAMIVAPRDKPILTPKVLKDLAVTPRIRMKLLRINLVKEKGIHFSFHAGMAFLADFKLL